MSAGSSLSAIAVNIRNMLDFLALLLNTLYCGDDLKNLRDYIRGSSVDLIYLDPRSKRYHDVWEL